MKANKLLLVIFILLSVVSCKEKLPDSYGIYIVSNNEQNALVPQKLIFRGNMFSSISGLKEASGSCSSVINNLIVFQKDIKPNNIFLTKLKFQTTASVSNLLGNSYIDVNLWTADNNIEIKIAPVDGKIDMYRIIPVSPLLNGFYAIHFGELTNQETLNSIDKLVYGFVIGSSIKPYQSVNNINKIENRAVTNSELDPDYSDSSVSQQEFYDNAKLLLDKANQYFNDKNYVELRKIYLNTDESEVNNTEWNKLTTGFRNWANQSGKIKSSTIITWNYEESKGFFKIQTQYEKVGLFDEELEVIFKNKSYYITFIGTK